MLVNFIANFKNKEIFSRLVFVYPKSILYVKSLFEISFLYWSDLGKIMTKNL